MSKSNPSTARIRVVREPERGVYDRATAYKILDEGFICHVGFIADGQPYVIPTSYGRKNDNLYIHGSAASRMLRQLDRGVPVCITVTLLDGLVLARSVFNHSINYRSAVIFGRGARIVDAAARLQALHAFTERLLPGRWQDARQPTEVELKQTTIVAVPIESASAKIRSGPPKDDEPDLDLPVWAGVLPLRLARGVPVADPQLGIEIAVPEYIRDYDRVSE